MPHAITLSDLSWATPDGHALFTDLTLTLAPERTGLVGRNGVGKTTLLRLIAGQLTPASGNVSTEASLGWLQQSVQTEPGATVADLFGVRSSLALLARAAAGAATVEELAEADWTLEERMAAALARVGLEVAPETRLADLSGGQRTRAGLAALIFREPEFLLLDEPTNNLDRDGRAAVLDLLRGWRGGAVVVSHDRELLEEMDAIVELTTLGTTRYGGGWSLYRAQKAQELAAAEQGLAEAERRLAEASKAAQARAERKARTDKSGKRIRASGGQSKMLLDKMKERSEGTGGAQARLAEARIGAAREAVEAAREKVEVLQPLAMELPPTGLPAGRDVVTVDDLAAGYGDVAVIQGLSFRMTGPERVAVTGPNGSGKTTLLSVLAGRLAPMAGAARVHVEFAMLDQSVGALDPRLSVLENFRRLNPGTDATAARAMLARFLFRGEAALTKVASLSGGQMLRAGLACAIGGGVPPQLLILDEPTNHLDLEAVEALEAALRGYDGALLVVSHDAAFLEAIGVTRVLDLG
ncbi:ABC-F family ATP-binding cassette domain-containing protein [Psychromarinibacter sp. C21-152]|uniref:ABC-F family ATP-binding cassette domain-containing protein n=1 Tax=Psychromarinibacter sediminicola TaxID=3033385 RepID=A0AAE3T895_9RHOB|nr:ABC-F family ATP-binding cassette domain-containing protein [Psychromarinibacter sediminicola]MDF0601175.1 ABC-F family ATP-binding cassette domain-containing protein [Psychromarinibacter sediminicola]